MKISISSAVMLISSLTTVFSGPPSDESLNQMMAAMHSEKMLDQMISQMDAGMKNGMEQGLQQSLQGRELSAGQREAVDKFESKLSAMMKEELSFTKTKDIYLQAYRETLTQEEVNTIITFYTSPAGKAVVEKVPLAMQKAGVLMQSRIGPIVQKIQGMQQDFAKDLAKIK